MTSDSSDDNKVRRTTLIDNTIKRVEEAYEQAGEPLPSMVVLAGLRFGDAITVRGRSQTLGRTGADANFPDSGVSRRHARIYVDGNKYWIEDLDSVNGTFVNTVRIEVPTVLQDGDKVHLGPATMLRFSFHDGLDRAFQSRIRESALRDSLTDAFNRRYLERRLSGELAYATRHDVPLSLLQVDVDDFHRINDNHGHLVGDDILVSAANSIHELLRSEDVLARIGSDEFVVLCRNTSSEAAHQLAERIVDSISDRTHASGAGNLAISVSVGIATFPDVQAPTPDRLLRAADAALFLAQRKGPGAVAAHAARR